MAVLDDIVEMIGARAQALALVIGGQAVDVERRTELVLLDGIDTKPIILYKASGPESSEPFDTEGAWKTRYVGEVCLATPANRDPTKDDAAILDARQELRDAFHTEDWPEVPEIFQVTTSSPQGPGGGHNAFKEGLRPDVIRLEFTCIEGRE